MELTQLSRQPVQFLALPFLLGLGGKAAEEIAEQLAPLPPWARG